MTYEFYPKDFKGQEDSIKLLLEAAKKMDEVIGCTMGPEGQLVMYEESEKNPWPTVTKDGVSVATMVRFIDQSKNMGAQFIIQAACKQVQETGDGTTLTTILIYKIYEQCINLIESGQTINYVVKNIKDLINQTIDHLNKAAKKKLTKAELEWIATISSNNDKELGKLIAEAVWKTGKFGLVSKQPNPDTKHYVKYQEGYTLNTGITNQKFVNCPNGAVRVDNPYVFICDQDIFYAKRITNIIKLIKEDADKSEDKEKPSLVLISPTISNELMNVFARNTSDPKTKIKLYWMKPTKNLAPEKRQFVMEDIATLTGGFFVSKECGFDIEGLTLDKIGRVRLISQNQNETMFMGYDKKLSALRVTQLKALKKDTKIEQKKDFAAESIARLMGGIATIYVGGANDSEQLEIIDRVDDAIRACKSALEEGYVAGGGVEFLKIISQLAIKDTDFADSIMSILQYPAQKILKNAGRTDWKDIIHRITFNDSQGYDIKTGADQDMREVGIIDPTMVLTRALKNSLSSAVSMLRTAVMIIHDYQGIKTLREFEGG